MCGVKTLQRICQKHERRFTTREIRQNQIRNAYTYPWGGWRGHGRGDLLWMRNSEGFIVQENYFRGSGVGLENDPNGIGRVGGNGIWLDGYARKNILLGNIVENVYRTAHYNQQNCEGNIWAFNIVVDARRSARFGPKSPHVRFLNNTIIKVREGGLYFDFHPRRVKNKLGTDEKGAFMNNIVYMFEKGAVWREIYSEQKDVYVNHNPYFTPGKDIQSSGSFLFQEIKLSWKEYLSKLKNSRIIDAESESIFFEDPQFTDITQKDFSPSLKSPVINKGISFGKMKALGILNPFERENLESFSPAFENRDIGAVEWIPPRG
jgi:hypothetical protein